MLESIDHLVLTVGDIEKTCAFYSRVLKMKKKTFGENRIALHFGQQKINLHDANRPVDKNVKHAKPGSADICFITLENIDTFLKHLEKENVKVIEGPGFRTGAMGKIESVYFYDPDENLIEIARYCD